MVNSANRASSQSYGTDSSFAPPIANEYPKPPPYVPQHSPSAPPFNGVGQQDGIGFGDVEIDACERDEVKDAGYVHMHDVEIGKDNPVRRGGEFTFGDHVVHNDGRTVYSDTHLFKHSLGCCISSGLTGKEGLNRAVQRRADSRGVDTSVAAQELFQDLSRVCKLAHTHFFRSYFANLVFVSMATFIAIYKFTEDPGLLAVKMLTLLVISILLRLSVMAAIVFKVR